MYGTGRLPRARATAAQAASPAPVVLPLTCSTGRAATEPAAVTATAPCSPERHDDAGRRTTGAAANEVRGEHGGFSRCLRPLAGERLQLVEVGHEDGAFRLDGGAQRLAVQVEDGGHLALGAESGDAGRQLGVDAPAAGFHSR